MFHKAQDYILHASELSQFRFYSIGSVKLNNSNGFKNEDGQNNEKLFDCFSFSSQN